VVEEGAQSRTLYLPEDRWVHLWSRRSVCGRRNHRPRADRPAAGFYRAESEIAGVMASLRNIR
jgi:alpha-glucosidase (family GH31 glycosyl hydrolase)